MANLLYRSSSTPTVPASTTVKNAPLTNLEIDGNFKSVNDDLANKPTLTGSGASGTWSISISGNAATATTATSATTATNLAAGSAGTIPYQTASNTTAMLAAGTSGQILQSNGTAAPSWVSLSSIDAGTVDGKSFGTFTAGGILYASTTAVSQSTAAGTSGQLLQSSGTGAPVWTSGLTYDSATGTLATSNFNSTSDVALKKNINNVVDATSTVSQLQGVEFEWKDSGKKSSGVIAQELEKILPHLVDQSADGIKNVNYAGLTAYLIESIKELSARLEKLENQ